MQSPYQGRKGRAREPKKKPWRTPLRCIQLNQPIDESFHPDPRHPCPSEEGRGLTDFPDSPLVPLSVGQQIHYCHSFGSCTSDNEHAGHTFALTTKYILQHGSYRLVPIGSSQRGGFKQLGATLASGRSILTDHNPDWQQVQL